MGKGPRRTAPRATPAADGVRPADLAMWIGGKIAEGVLNCEGRRVRGLVLAPQLITNPERRGNPVAWVADSIDHKKPEIVWISVDGPHISFLAPPPPPSRRGPRMGLGAGVGHWAVAGVEWRDDRGSGGPGGAGVTTVGGHGGRRWIGGTDHRQRKCSPAWMRCRIEGRTWASGGPREK